jgi:hypothetical protein
MYADLQFMTKEKQMEYHCVTVHNTKIYGALKIRAPSIIIIIIINIHNNKE